VDEKLTPVQAYSAFGADGNVAVVYGKALDGCLVRIHSRCTYSEIFASRECDCGWQLQMARHKLAHEGGVLVYLDQEGRGAGLRAKAHAYRMYQDDKIDTYQAYETLGLAPDSRDYTSAVQFLKEELHLNWVKLLTNNPDKIAALENGGIKVEREPLVATPTPASMAYLTAKKRHGHLLLRGAATGPGLAFRNYR
jgi:GTP cyclohydrolase II